MNYHFFAMKRAYHATLRLTRDVAAAYGLTPARSDMLYAIYCVPVYGPAGRGELSQSALRQRLGVSAPTVSRMIRSLEALGFVSRRRSSQDRRTFDIQLTDLGWRRVRTMFFEIFKWDIFDLALDCALVGATRAMNTDKVDEERSCLYSIIGKLRWAFRDRATLEYPNFVDPESQFRM
jgi:DNA-binding MarR family transcriptional regulator